MRLIIVILLFVSLKVSATDTLKMRVLHHPLLHVNYCTQKRFFEISSETEFFFEISNNKMLYPGFSVHDSLLYKRILQIFDSSKCLGINKTIFFSAKSFRFFRKIGHLKKNYYVGLVFYAFDIRCIVDSAKTPLSVLDLSEIMGARMVEKRDVKVPTIVKFLEINVVPLRKHKLKKNGKIYPIK